MAEPQTLSSSEQSEIEPDDAEGLSSFTEADADSALGQESFASTTTSLRSSLLVQLEENGRKYHSFRAGSYFMPNDETENERLDFQHHIFLLAFDMKLTTAPLPSKLKRVLDVGCGTGVWAIDFADEHPEAEVIGVDLSATQPRFVPPNLKFEIDDLELPWTFSYRFDFIHSRFLLGCFTDVPRYFRQAFEFLEPGGIFEVIEVHLPVRTDDDSLPQDSYMWRWGNLLVEAFARLGRPIHIIPQYRQMLADAGFESIAEHRCKCPTNAWPKDRKYKELGVWTLENGVRALEAATYAPFSRALGWSKEDIDTFLVGVTRELKDKSIHAYWPLYFLHARKPTTA